MKYTVSILLGVIATTLAAPSLNNDIQTAHLTFRSDASNEAYKLTVKADGTSVPTNNDTLVSLIDAPDYLARSQCKFDTVDKVELSTTIASNNVTQQVVLKPASAIRSVTCEGMCVYTYGT